MKISILTLFPQIFLHSLNFSILKRAQIKKKVEFQIINIRDFAMDKHKSVDDHPYGGGVGMILRVDIIDRALSSLKINQPRTKSQKIRIKVILLDPRGKVFHQKMAKSYSKLDHLILICGHYEGVDERVLKLVDESVSIGDYILTGGEFAALVVTDAIVRLIPNVLSKKQATVEESFYKIDTKQPNLLSFPQYTRPKIYKNMSVPQILLSGDHDKIRLWRGKLARELTQKNRPDLLE